MMRKILFTNTDGSLSVVHPVCNTIGETLTTDAEIEQRAWDKLPVDAINPVFVDESVIPTDRTFRNAWEHGGDSVIQNITKAKTIAHDKRREARSTEFAPLDIKATIPSEATAAEAARQVIRDKYAAMQTAIDAATTADQIKAAMPQEDQA
jgi:hypothetical protein